MTGPHATAEADLLGPGTEATGNDYPAVFMQRLIDRLHGFLHRGIDKTTGIDDHHIRLPLIGDDLITLGAQPGQDLFGIHRGLGAAQADETNLAGFLCG